MVSQSKRTVKKKGEREREREREREKMTGDNTETDKRSSQLEREK